MQNDFKAVESSPIANFLEMALFSAAGLGMITLVIGACAEAIHIL